MSVKVVPGGGVGNSSFYLPMAGRGDEIEHGMNPVVPEAGVTLDTRLLRQNIIILSLEIPHDLREATVIVVSLAETKSNVCKNNAYLASLSIWSPKPGVSTMVKEIRVPSSSNSSSARR